MDWRAKFRWVAHQALLLFILVSVAFLSAITTVRLAIHGREVEMPRLVGLKAGDAQALLQQTQLGFRIVDRVYSDQPKDAVVRQSPPPGTRVKVRQRAHVILSLGPQQVTIPELEGKSIRAARIEILRSGLQVGEVSSAYLGPPAQGQETGIVLKQNPPPQARNAGSPRVNLLVNQPEREAAYVMPNLTGLLLPEAERRLGAAGLRIAKVTQTPLVAALPGTVVAQTPARGARVASSTPIELQVVE
jgi:beta-lactam-binding protein with PASTA domain